MDEVNASHSTKSVEMITPKEYDERGCQVSMLMAVRGREIFESLIEQGVVADWREPDVIRIAPVPLYNTFEDVYRFGNIINKPLDGK